MIKLRSEVECHPSGNEEKRKVISKCPIRLHTHTHTQYTHIERKDV